jgi:hypothetical protein
MIYIFLRVEPRIRLLKQLQRNNGGIQSQLMIRKHIQNVIGVQKHLLQQHRVPFDRGQATFRQFRNPENTRRKTENSGVIQLQLYCFHQLPLLDQNSLFSELGLADVIDHSVQGDRLNLAQFTCHEHAHNAHQMQILHRPRLLLALEIKIQQMNRTEDGASLLLEQGKHFDYPVHHFCSLAFGDRVLTQE